MHLFCLLNTRYIILLPLVVSRQQNYLVMEGISLVSSMLWACRIHILANSADILWDWRFWDGCSFIEIRIQSLYIDSRCPYVSSGMNTSVHHMLHYFISRKCAKESVNFAMFPPKPNWISSAPPLHSRIPVTVPLSRNHHHAWVPQFPRQDEVFYMPGLHLSCFHTSAPNSFLPGHPELRVDKNYPWRLICQKSSLSWDT